MRRDGMTPLPTGVATLDVEKKLTLKNIFLNKANCASKKPQLEPSNR